LFLTFYHPCFGHILFITPGNVADNNLRLGVKLCKVLCGKLFGDKGYISEKLRESLAKQELFLFSKIIYAKQAFGSAESVVEYLGRYTHRVAISNTRILKVTETHVTFGWCDRENGYQKKTETIPGIEFLKRFLDHIVPPYFRRRIQVTGTLSIRTGASGKCGSSNLLTPDVL